MSGPAYFFYDQHAEPTVTIDVESAGVLGVAPDQQVFYVGVTPPQKTRIGDAVTLTVFAGEGDDLIIEQFVGVIIDVATTTPDDVRFGGPVLGQATLDVISATDDNVPLETGAEQFGQVTIDVLSSTPDVVVLVLDQVTDALDLDAISAVPDDALIFIDTRASVVIDVLSEEPTPLASLIISVAADVTIDAVTATPDDADFNVAGQAFAIVTIDAISSTPDDRTLVVDGFANVTIDVVTDTSDPFIGGIPTCLTNRTSGRRTLLLIQDEDVWGEVSPDQVPYIFEITSETLVNNIQWLDGRQNVSTGRGARSGLKGRHDVAGQIVGELQPNGPWAMIMRHVLTSRLPNSEGSVLPQTTAVHSLPAEDELPPGFTLEKHFIYPDGRKDYYRYTGCRVDAVTLRMANAGPISVTADIVCKDEVRVFAPLHDTPTVVPDNEPFNSLLTQVEVSPPQGITAVATAIEWTIRNNLRRDQYTIQSGRSRSRILPRRREISGVMSLFLTDETFDYYQGALDNEQFDLEIINFVSGAPFPNWVWDLGKIEFRGTTPVIPGPGPINITLPFISLSQGDPSPTLTIFNDDPILSTAI